MDEAAVGEGRGAPLEAALRQIAALKSLADLPALLAHQHLTLYASSMLFDFGSSQDYADSSSVIAFADAGGLGLPDRDYYTKTDAKSEEIRQKYVEHMAQMLQLARRFAGASRGRSDSRHAHRNRAGQGFAHARGTSATLTSSSTK